MTLYFAVRLGYGWWLALATQRAVAVESGRQSGLPVDQPVTIARDVRGVPHIRAATVHDLFVAEGYAMASDRLFQMDLTRRFVDGRLAEILGSPLTKVDRFMRRYAIRELAAQVYAHASAQERAGLDAFAAGINAAATQQPVPPEYKALFAHFEPWRPEDALAVGFATLLDLDDRPQDVIERDQIRRLLGATGTDALYPLTDPHYDVPTDGSAPGVLATLPPLPTAHAAPSVALADERPPIGSNAWAAGAERTTDGKAILANDPHLDLAIPGIWYLVEASAPGMHIAGAALAGTPGVTLGHNEHLAWGVTAGETAAIPVWRERIRGDQLLENGRWVTARHRHEQIVVRFGHTIDEDFLETARGVVIQRDGDAAYVMDWRMRRAPVSPLAPFLRLLTARTTADGVAAMRALPEPALNVLFADDRGTVAYHLAGGIPLLPSAGRWADDPIGPEPALLPYDRAAHVDPARTALIVTSNNRVSGAAAPRLAPFWPPPYRAFEIHRALGAATDAHHRSSPDAIAAEQSDADSPSEAEFRDFIMAAGRRTHADRNPALAPLFAAVRNFDGRLLPASQGASVIVALRLHLVGEIAATHLPTAIAQAYPPTGPGFEIVLRALRERPKGWVVNDDYDAFIVDGMSAVHALFGKEIPTFGVWAAQLIAHPLAPFGFTHWNGPTFPGRGGSFAPAVQWNGHGQSFRALWIAGDWDAGTINVDAGESGEPGSPHYTDQAADWANFQRTTLPFSDAAVRRATTETLTLTR
ncbi:MAG TPA: penicillin acylase family protein [Candidatus Sulfotelmatobacter sp.]|nr:penicillin acylase family protein [Candidatus Sulfotelmatobacter sp.]